jgi:hypothetical protein
LLTARRRKAMLKARRIALLAVVLCVSVSALGDVSFPLIDSQGRDSGWTMTAPSFLGVNVVTDYVHEDDEWCDTYVLIEVFKKFRVPPDEQDQFSPINLTFTQTAPDAQTVPNIRIADETITNLTGADWYDFHWILSKFGYASFNTDIPVYTGVPDPPEEVPAGVWDVWPFRQYAWDTSQPNTEKLSVFDGVIPPGGVYHPGIYSSGYLEINVDLLTPQEPFSFDLKELPTIPEPATLTLLAVGAAAMIHRRRRAG